MWPRRAMWVTGSFGAAGLAAVVFAPSLPSSITKEQLNALSSLGAEEDIERIDVRSISVDDFRKRFEADGGKPVLILGATKHWKAQERWQPEKLYERFKAIEFSCTHNNHAKLPFWMLYHNATSVNADRAMYIFDSLDDADFRDAILPEYEVPPFFSDDNNSDLFATGCARDHWLRPEYRWFLLGPPGSGSTLHQDPYATSAWNASLVGRKRWVLFPPGTPEAHLKPSRKMLGLAGSVFDLETNHWPAFEWFTQVLPKLRTGGSSTESGTDRSSTHVRPLEVVQQPGEVMFVPAGWWHIVINLDLTVAITQNYASPYNRKEALAAIRQEHPLFYRALSKELCL